MRYIVLSLIIHISIVLLVLIGPLKSSKQLKQEPNKPGTNYVSFNELNRPIVERKPATLIKTPCQRFYFGIGFYHVDNKVVQIIDGYPASKSLMVGDQLENNFYVPEIDKMPFTLIVNRNGVKLYLKFITTKICTI